MCARSLVRKVSGLIHPVGWQYIAICMTAAIVGSLAWKGMFCVGTAAALWCAYFFRDPRRVTPVRPGLLISPADGKITGIAKVVPPAEIGLGDAEVYKISIFLSVFDVHINRVPIDSTVEAKVYFPGKHINACLDKASVDNERLAMRLRLVDGRAIGVVQIAGLIARRIVSWVAEGQPVKAGERFGMIKFGSRADVYLPEGVSPLVTLGQYMAGGETVLADLQSNEPPRVGEVR
ncbi:MAG: phosphatidylserine decarboxylase [Rhodospirillaceae bacterium]